jgi:pSer/pThr/pTyr-binding forkhead associated (FHA) protein
MSAAYDFQLLIEGPQGERRFLLPPGITIIGREADSDLRLEHPQVSRRHAQIQCSLEECLLTDLGSVNGTYVDGQKLTHGEPRRLLPQAAVRIGPYRLVLEEVSAGEQPAQPEVPDPAQPDQVPGTAPGTEPGTVEMATIQSLMQRYSQIQQCWSRLGR